MPTQEQLFNAACSQLTNPDVELLELTIKAYLAKPDDVFKFVQHRDLKRKNDIWMLVQCMIDNQKPCYEHLKKYASALRYALRV